MVISDLRKQDRNWMLVIHSLPGVMIWNLETSSSNRGLCSVLGLGELIEFSWAWMTYFSKLSPFLWTNFMLTDLVSVPVVNVLPLGSRSTVRYLLEEHWDGPCKYFSFSICQDDMPGEGKEGSALFPRLLCDVWPLPWPGPCSMQQPMAPGAQ